MLPFLQTLTHLPDIFNNYSWKNHGKTWPRLETNHNFRSRQWESFLCVYTRVTGRSSPHEHEWNLLAIFSATPLSTLLPPWETLHFLEIFVPSKFLPLQIILNNFCIVRSSYFFLIIKVN